MFISVDLPEPDWPTMAIISPASISRLMSSSTVTVSAPVTNRRVRPRSTINGVATSASARTATTAAGGGAEQDGAAAEAAPGIAVVDGGAGRTAGSDHEVALVEAADDFRGDVVVEADLHLGRMDLARRLIINAHAVAALAAG